MTLRSIVRAVLRNPIGRRLVSLAIRLTVARHRVGVAGVVFDGDGRILLLEHLVRARYAWGLPGGWVDRGESPAAALERELREETGIGIEVGEVLLCEAYGGERGMITPGSISIAYACTARDGATASPSSREILSLEWRAPEDAGDQLISFHRRAIAEAMRRRA
jgi:8-oxo-dGTP diphosphatase